MLAEEEDRIECLILDEQSPFLDNQHPSSQLSRTNSPQQEQLENHNAPFTGLESFPRSLVSINSSSGLLIKNKNKKRKQKTAANKLCGNSYSQNVEDGTAVDGDGTDYFQNALNPNSSAHIGSTIDMDIFSRASKLTTDLFHGPTGEIMAVGLHRLVVIKPTPTLKQPYDGVVSSICPVESIVSISATAQHPAAITRELAATVKIEESSGDVLEFAVGLKDAIPLVNNVKYKMQLHPSRPVAD